MFQFNSSCLLHVSNIMCSSSGRPYVHAGLCGMFFVHLCKQLSNWKDVRDTFLLYLEILVLGLNGNA